MATLIIRNLGPIVEAELDLKKVNVFMGPQSSGKSTIVKVLSTCRWIEKQSYFDSFNLHNYHLKDLLIEFHRFDESFFNDDTNIDFKSDDIRILYTKELGCEIISPYETYEFLVEKINNIKYIPAERNLASAVPNIIKYADNKDNLLSFLFDWFEARQFYKEHNAVNILNLNASYYYNKEQERDVVSLSNNVKFPLKSASSGLQSIIPLQLLVSHSCKYLYDRIPPLSFNTIQNIKELYNRSLNSPFMNESHQKILEGILSYEKNLYNFTQLFIEEPEQNLYPETQKELVNSLIGAIQYNSLNHRLALTTHSPYILYALNNSMMYYLVKDKLSEESRAKVVGMNGINPKDVAIWEIANGRIKNIQDEDGLISTNYFDSIMQGIMDEFYTLLEYYGK